MKALEHRLGVRNVLEGLEAGDEVDRTGADRVELRRVLTGEGGAGRAMVGGGVADGVCGQVRAQHAFGRAGAREHAGAVAHAAGRVEDAIARADAVAGEVIAGQVRIGAAAGGAEVVHVQEARAFEPVAIELAQRPVGHPLVDHRPWEGILLELTEGDQPHRERVTTQARVEGRLVDSCAIDREDRPFRAAVHGLERRRIGGDDHHRATRDAAGFGKQRRQQVGAQEGRQARAHDGVEGVGREGDREGVAHGGRARGGGVAAFDGGRADVDALYADAVLAEGGHEAARSAADVEDRSAAADPQQGDGEALGIADHGPRRGRGIGPEGVGGGIGGGGSGHEVVAASVAVEGVEAGWASETTEAVMRRSQTPPKKYSS